MYLYGSTITATRYPKFVHEGKEYVLPRPYQHCKPNQDGNTILSNHHVLKYMLKDIEFIVVCFLQSYCKDRDMAMSCLMNIAKSKEKIPENLRLGGTFFTHCTVIGTFEEVNAEIPPHFDEKDLISVVFHAGKIKSGGETIYYDGCKKNDIGNVVYSMPFQHGRIQIGFYQNVIHSVKLWVGTRCLINFNLKAKVLEHFVKHDMKYYDNFMKMGCPNGTFVSF